MFWLNCVSKAEEIMRDHTLDLNKGPQEKYTDDVTEAQIKQLLWYRVDFHLANRCMHGDQLVGLGPIRLQPSKYCQCHCRHCRMSGCCLDLNLQPTRSER